jgi:predicted glycoside hydrolase/deacetylase ChbG (UPF0249 family)
VIRTLIINADDFGFSRAVTDGIVHAHTHGILTSTTLMATMPDCDRAIDLAGSHPSLGVGIHLCLTQGTPRSTKLRHLTSADGQFPHTVPQLLQRISLNRKALQEVKAEWAGQIGYALSRHLQPTHLDSHKHIHHWPALGRIAIELAKEYGITSLRCAREIQLPGLPGLTPGYKVLRFLARRLHDQIARHQLHTSDWFYGLAVTGGFSAEIWRQLLEHLPPGTGEIMVHPGYCDDLELAATRLKSQRRLELDGLCDTAVATKVKAAAIELVHFGNIKKNQPAGTTRSGG